MIMASGEINRGNIFKSIHTFFRRRSYFDLFIRLLSIEVVSACSLLLALLTVGALRSASWCDFATLLSFLRSWLIVVIILITVLIIRIRLFNDSEIVLKSQWDKVILNIVTHVEIVVHLLPNFVLLIIAIIVITGLLGALGGLHCLEEVEEGVRFDSGRHCLGLSTGLDLLLFLFLSWITSLCPCNVCSDALFDHIWTCHHKLLLQLGASEV